MGDLVAAPVQTVVVVALHFGPSGAYAVVQMDVTAGNVYCL